MPTIFRVGRYRFLFYSNEGDEPPHIHVKADRLEARFWLTPVSLAANFGFKRHELSEIEAIVLTRRDELTEAWNEHFN